MASNVYQVKPIDGKGLGCFASMDIRKGALILSENPQIPGRTSEEKQDENKWIRKLFQSFSRLSKADQIEYMTLHDKYNDIQALPSEMKSRIEKELSVAKSNIKLIENDKDQVEKIMKIYNINSTNSFGSGLKIKTSRLNHSCQPNASAVQAEIDGQWELRAISKIKAGEEITINYGTKEFGFRKRKFRQKYLFDRWFFNCSCNMCETTADEDDKNELDELLEEIEKLREKRFEALEMGQAYVKFRFFTST